MASISVWRGTASATDWPRLENEVTAEVAIVGGGITGVTAALLLAQAGRSVALVEAGRIGSGDTGNSTGNLYETVSVGLDVVKQKWGSQVARLVVQSRREAMALIGSHVKDLGIDCGFRRCPMHIYAGSVDARPDIESEFDAARSAGLAVRRENAVPTGPPAAHGPSWCSISRRSSIRWPTSGRSRGMRTHEDAACSRNRPSWRWMRTGAWFARPPGP